ncbi:MAG TPA: 2OG-Fe(II) oxygenase, partial [Kofleriaceae bacterium]|nr:2OG-Fe(II) oxygenase [Kofleriaceae bacterium]
MLRESIDWAGSSHEFVSARPFNHIVFDEFFAPEIADALANECPAYDAPLWYAYDNAIENKKAMNHWDRFGPTTYRVMTMLNSPAFVANLEQLTGARGLAPDIGLHGGGWHAHGRGGKLNVHVDYSIHPKLALERRLNLIVYLSRGWDESWGGGLGLWTHDAERNQPRELAKTVACRFN